MIKVADIQINGILHFGAAANFINIFKDVYKYTYYKTDDTEIYNPIKSITTLFKLNTKNPKLTIYTNQKNKAEEIYNILKNTEVIYTGMYRPEDIIKLNQTTIKIL